jgi:hypothetical protein
MNWVNTGGTPGGGSYDWTEQFREDISAIPHAYLEATLKQAAKNKVSKASILAQMKDLRDDEGYTMFDDYIEEHS